MPFLWFENVFKRRCCFGDSAFPLGGARGLLGDWRFTPDWTKYLVDVVGDNVLFSCFDVHDDETYRLTLLPFASEKREILTVGRERRAGIDVTSPRQLPWF